jgi:hypothetical protein
MESQERNQFTPEPDEGIPNDNLSIQPDPLEPGARMFSEPGTYDPTSDEKNEEATVEIEPSPPDLEQVNILGPSQTGSSVGDSDVENPVEIEPPPAPSWSDFKEYFWRDGNLRTLMATSFCWFALDLPFYGLGMNTPSIIEIIWYGQSAAPENIYPLLVSSVWQSLIVVSLGAVIGCVITFITIDKLGRRNIQINGFFWLFVLFIVIGGSFNHLYEIGGTAATVVLYILCQIFFNFGMMVNLSSYLKPD